MTDEDLIDAFVVAALKVADRGLLSEAAEDTAEQLEREGRYCRGIVDHTGSCQGCGRRIVEPLLGHEVHCLPRALPASVLYVRDVWRSARWHLRWLAGKRSPGSR